MHKVESKNMHRKKENTKKLRKMKKKRKIKNCQREKCKIVNFKKWQKNRTSKK